MSNPIIDWNNPSPGIWTATIKIADGMVSDWVRHYDGKSVKTPEGRGRIIECSPNEELGTVEIKVRIGPDL